MEDEALWRIIVEAHGDAPDLFRDRAHRRVPLRGDEGALPSSTIDSTIEDGLRDVPIEERPAREVTHVRGRAEDGRLHEVEVVAPGSPVAKWPGVRRDAGAPRHGLIITERGVAAASRAGLLALYPERSGG